MSTGQAFKKGELARRAGVSAAAVSRYLNHRGYLSAEKRERIRQALEEMGFDREPAPGRRAAGWKVFAIVVPPFSGEHYYSEMSARFEAHADRSGFHALIRHLNLAQCSLLDALRPLTRRPLAGIFLPSLPYMELRREELDFLSGSEVPILLVSEFAQPYPTLNCLVLENRRAAAEAVDHLAGAGCRRLAFLCPSPAVNKAAGQRAQGFLERTDQLGLAGRVFEVPLRTRMEPALGWEAAKAAFQAAEWDGLLCYSDVFAAGALWHLARTGRPVPRQVKLMAFQNELAPFLCPPVSTMLLDTDQIARLAVEQLARLQDPVERMIVRQIPVRPRLLARPSTGPDWTEGPRASASSIIL